MTLAKVVIADYDYGDVDIERAIVEQAGFELVAAQCKTEDEVIEVAHDAAGTRSPTMRWRCCSRWGARSPSTTGRRAAVGGSGNPEHRSTACAEASSGLLSFGAIARAVAARAQGFGMRITAHDPYLSAEEISATGARGVSFDELLTESCGA